MSWTRIAVAFLMLETLTGCGTTVHTTTLSKEGASAGPVIYRISEDTAFTTALDAYAGLLPKQSGDDTVDGSRRGYSANENIARLQ
jgi:hypothetical protein